MAIQDTNNISGNSRLIHNLPDTNVNPTAQRLFQKGLLQQRFLAQAAPPIAPAPPSVTTPGAPALPLPVLLNPNAPQTNPAGQTDYGLEPYNPPPALTIPTYKPPAKPATQGPAQAPMQGVINQPPVKTDAPIDIQTWNSALDKISSTLQLELLSPKAQLLINQQADKNPGLNTEYALGLQTPADGQNLALVGSLKEIIAFLSVKDNAERFVHMLNPNASVTLTGLDQRYDKALNAQANLIALNQARAFLKDLQTATMPGNPSFKQLYPNLSISTVEDRSSTLQNGFLANQRANQNGAGLNQTYIFEFDYPVLFTDGKTRSVAINLAGPLESLGPFIERGGYSWLTANGLTGNQKTGLTPEGLITRYETAKTSIFDPNKRNENQTGSTVDTQLVKPVEQLTLDDEESTIPKALPFGSDKSPFISVKPTDPDQQNNIGVIGLQPKDAIQPPRPDNTNNVNNSSDPIKASASDSSPQNSSTESTETDTQPDDWVNIFVQDAKAGMQAFIQAYPKIQQALFNHINAINEVSSEQVVSSIARGQQAVAAIHQIRQSQTPESLPATLAGNQELPKTPLADMQAILKELLHGTGIKVQEVITLATQHWNMHPYELAWDIRMQNVLHGADKLANKSEGQTSKTRQNIQTAANWLDRAILGYAKTVGSDQVDTRDLTTAMYFNGENISISGVPFDGIMINGTPLTKASLVSLFGIPDNSNVKIKSLGQMELSYLEQHLLGTISQYGYKLEVKTPFTDGTIHYYLVKNQREKWEIARESLVAKTGAPQGYASRIMAHLLSNAEKLGISGIFLEAGKGNTNPVMQLVLKLRGYEENKSLTGYYTWPAHWGANAPLYLDILENIPDSINIAWQNFLDKQVQQGKLTSEQAIKLKPLNSLIKLTATREGRQYWKEHGETTKVSIIFDSNDPSLILSKQRAEDTMKKLGIRIYPLYGQQATDNNNPGTQSTIQRTIIGPDGETPINITTNYTPEPTKNTLDIDALNPGKFDAITRTEKYRDANLIQRYQMGLEALGGIPTWEDATETQRRVVEHNLSIDALARADSIKAWIKERTPSLIDLLGEIFHEIHPVLGYLNNAEDFNHPLPRYLVATAPDINNIQLYNTSSIQNTINFLANMLTNINYSLFEKLLPGADKSMVIKKLSDTASRIGFYHNKRDAQLFSEAMRMVLGDRINDAKAIIKSLFIRNYPNTNAEKLRNEYAAALTVMHLTGADKIRDMAISQINVTDGDGHIENSEHNVKVIQQLVNWAANTRLPSPAEFEAYYKQIKPLIPIQAFEQNAKQWNIIFQQKRGEISIAEAQQALTAIGLSD